MNCPLLIIWRTAWRGDTVFHVDRGEVQDLLHHRLLQMTKATYSHIEVEERAKRVSDILDSVE
jgi:integrase